MDIAKSSVRTKAAVPVQSVRHSVKSDMVLPDYYADIKKILKCGVVPSVEAVNISDGKISIAGAALFSLMYTGDDKKIYVYEAEEKYTKALNCTEIENGDDIKVSQHTTSVDFRAFGPKRIELSVDIQTEVSAIRLQTRELICAVDEPDIETHRRSEKIFSPSCSTRRDINIDAASELTDFSVNTDTVIRKQARIQLSEIKTAENKVHIKGSCDISLVYQKGNAGRICTHSFSSAFSQIIDVYGVNEGDECKITPETGRIKVNVKSTGENSASADIGISVKLSVFSGRQTDIEYIDDAYCVSGEINASYGELNLIKGINENSRTVNVSFDIEDFDRAGGNICDCFIENIRVSTEKNENGETNILLAASYNVLVEAEGTGFALLTRNYISEYKAEPSDIGTQAKEFFCRPVSINALSLPDGKIRINADFILGEYSEELISGRLLAEISRDGKTGGTREENITLYYAHAGESLWNIAKENKSTTEAIKTANGMTGECVTDERVLVLPGF